jgi:hypothetical protein
LMIHNLSLNCVLIQRDDCPPGSKRV